MSATRIEHDSLGEVTLPTDAVYGVHTHRALQNFPITDVPLSHFPELVRALAMVKKAAAMANRDLGELSPQRAKPIIAVCNEIIEGEHHEHFAVDVVAGRRRHLDQHERQRGDCESRPQEIGPRLWRVRPPSSERSCKSFAVDQRRLSHGDPVGGASEMRSTGRRATPPERGILSESRRI